MAGYCAIALFCRVQFGPVDTFFFLQRYGAHLSLHSFPTRRSSDLEERAIDSAVVSSTGVARQSSCDGCLLGLCALGDRKSTRLNSSHVAISYAVFCLKKKIRPSSRGWRVLAPPTRHSAPSPTVAVP